MEQEKVALMYLFLKEKLDSATTNHGLLNITDGSCPSPR